MQVQFSLKPLAVAFLSAGLLAGCVSNLQRGLDAGRSGDYQTMLKACEMAAKESNADPEAFKCIGDAQMRLGNRSAAETAYLTYLDHVSDSVEVRLILANMYLADGRLAAAQKQAEEAVKYDPSAYEGYYYLGEIHRTNGACEASRSAYKRALEIYPNYDAAKAGLEKLDKVCPPKKKKKVRVRPRVKHEKILRGGGKALREGEW